MQHPMLGRTLIASCALGCSSEMVIIAAALSVQVLFIDAAFIFVISLTQS
jgi:HrpA-like RNA helicase